LAVDYLCLRRVGVALTVVRRVGVRVKALARLKARRVSEQD
jgi:hypothetical protein